MANAATKGRPLTLPQLIPSWMGPTNTTTKEKQTQGTQKLSKTSSSPTSILKNFNRPHHQDLIRLAPKSLLALPDGLHQEALLPCNNPKNQLPRFGYDRKGTLGRHHGKIGGLKYGRRKPMDENSDGSRLHPPEGGPMATMMGVYMHTFPLFPLWYCYLFSLGFIC